MKTSSSRASTLITTSDDSQPDPFKNKPSKISGIVYFDVDDTLTNMPDEDRERIIRHCVDRGYKVGIITASMRTPGHACTETGDSGAYWSSNSLCNELKNDKFKLFNSLLYTSGDRNFIFPSFGNGMTVYGRQKGWQMLESSRQFGVDPSNTYLFDDNKSVLVGAEEINPTGNFVYVNNNTQTNTLDYNMISRIIV